MRVICIVGLPGSGKGEVSKFFKERGTPVVNMGDVVRDEAVAKDRAVTPENLGKVSIGLRRRYGGEEIARRCMKKIEKIAADEIVIEGIRSFEEVKFFRKRLSRALCVIAVHCAPKTRFERLKKRGRRDDTEKWEVFEERDMRELGYGMGTAIALADFTITNDGSIAELREKIKNVCKKLPETVP